MSRRTSPLRITSNTASRHLRSCRLPANPIEGLKETVRWLTSAFDLRIELLDLVAEGDKVLAYITMRGTHEGDF